MTHGYARISTEGQSLDGQVKKLRAVGGENVWRETASRAKTDRAQLSRAIRLLDAGDVLMVCRDRLRDRRATFSISWRGSPTRDRGEDRQQGGPAFRSLADTWADTTTPPGRSMLTVLGGLAEFERELIRTRTGEGRARAKERGVKLGRRPKLTPHQRREAITRRDSGEPIGDIARSYNVHNSTISRLSAHG
jgi:DNA invertase Pin-like site-specific DNA recombinase